RRSRNWRALSSLTSIPMHELSPKRHVAKPMLDRASRRKIRLARGRPTISVAVVEVKSDPVALEPRVGKTPERCHEARRDDGLGSGHVEAIRPVATIVRVRQANTLRANDSPGRDDTLSANSSWRSKNPLAYTAVQRTHSAITIRLPSGSL